MDTQFIDDFVFELYDLIIDQVKQKNIPDIHQLRELVQTAKNNLNFTTKTRYW